MFPRENVLTMCWMQKAEYDILLCSPLSLALTSCPTRRRHPFCPQSRCPCLLLHSQGLPSPFSAQYPFREASLTTYLLATSCPDLIFFLVYIVPELQLLCSFIAL